MDFLRPALLAGLGAVLLPVIIHLLGRRRLKPVPVATLRFLERARARASAHLKLRRILLLLARMAALAALALLYAGPGCRTAGRAAGPATWVLVLDTSPSMAASRRGPSCLERAREALLAVVDAGSPGDRYLLATTREGDERWRRGFSADVAGLRQALKAAGIEHGVHRPDRALENAFALLEGERGGRVVLATDLQASGWDDRPVAGAGSAPLSIVDAGLHDPANGWVAEVHQQEGEVSVRLGRSGPGEGGRRTVRLTVGSGAPLTAFVEGSEASFHVKPPAAFYTGEVEAEPGGDLADDDRLAFVGQGSSGTRVLLVNGDPRGFEIQDELLFVRRALASGGRVGETFQVREVRQGDLDPADFGGADVILLANPGPLSAATAQSLKARVEAGAGLLVSAGDRWSPESAAADNLAPLLAAPLRDVVAIRPDDASRRPFETLEPASFAGPAALFRDPAAGDLTGTRVHRYWVLDARAGEHLSVWMRLDNGAPLLVERRLGKGRTLLLTTTVDRDGANLCLQPGFLPWLERVLLHAAGRLKPPLERSAVAGRPVVLPYAEAVEVEGPGRERTPWRPGGPPFVPPEPGVYRILASGEAVDAFAARTDPAESDLTRLTPAALDARLGAGRYALGAPGGGALAAGLGSARRDVSAAVAAVLVAALILEAILSARWRPRRRLSVLEEEGP